MKTNQTTKPHIHAEVIKAWAEGEEIQYMNIARMWVDAEWNNPNAPVWREDMIFRVKPEPKPDVVTYGLTTYYSIDGTEFNNFRSSWWPEDNLKLTFDGETGKLKSAEVINK